MKININIIEMANGGRGSATGKSGEERVERELQLGDEQGVATPTCGTLYS